MSSGTPRTNSAVNAGGNQLLNVAECARELELELERENAKAEATLSIVRDALADLKRGKLTEGACLMAIAAFVNPQRPTEADIEWAKEHFQ